MTIAAVVITAWAALSLAVAGWLWVESRRVPPVPEPSLLDLIARNEMAGFFAAWDALVEREAA